MTKIEKSPRRGPKAFVAYGGDVREQVLAYAAAGLSPREIARQPGMPHWLTIERWRRGKSIAYSPALANELAIRVAAGRPVSEVCEDTDMPSLAVLYQWLLVHESLALVYAKAREIAAYGLVAEIRKLAEQAEPENLAVHKLKIATYQWEAARLAPQTFGALTGRPAVRRAARPEAIINLELIQYGQREDVDAMAGDEGGGTDDDGANPANLGTTALPDAVDGISEPGRTEG